MNSIFLPLAAMVFVAALSGLVGVFALTRRMTLAADALSHIALPGLGIAMIMNFDPLLGGAALLILGAFLIWSIERKTKISTETVIGVVFSASLALGSLLIGSDESLLDALFGNYAALTFAEATTGIFVALLLICLILYLKEKLTLAFISQDLAKTAGLNVEKLNLLYLVIFAVTVMLGLKFLGALLMGSLVIVPAAASRNFAPNFKADLVIALAFSVFSMVVGFFIAQAYGIALGPTAITVAAAIFFVSIFFRRRS